MKKNSRVRHKDTYREGVVIKFGPYWALMDFFEHGIHHVRREKLDVLK